VAENNKSFDLIAYENIELIKLAVVHSKQNGCNVNKTKYWLK
jgi:hypothetical protein